MRRISEKDPVDKDIFYICHIFHKKAGFYVEIAYSLNMHISKVSVSGMIDQDVMIIHM